METGAKAFPDYVITLHEMGLESYPEPGLKRRVLAYNDKLLLAEHELAKGWVGTVHSHPHDQVVYVVRGHLKVTCMGRAFEVRGRRQLRRPR
jgi:quercetin dioxygenase-like cupin family protein